MSVKIYIETNKTNKIMELKCEKIVVIEVEYSDLEEFVRKEFNQNGYELIPDEELNNNMTKTYDVEPKEMDQKVLMDFIRHNKGMYLTGKLLDQLCFEGKLDEGKYNVDICW